MKKVFTANEAVAHAVVLSGNSGYYHNKQGIVIAAYPITPQTSIIETLASLCAEGVLKNSQYIAVESEHSAMAACISASQAGVRTFTATSSQGLLLMDEMLWWAAGARLPIVMVNVNRAIAFGWSIWTDQNDSLSKRDTGWIQIYCKNNQEVLDHVLMAYRLAEHSDVLLPVMIVLDAFVLSHTAELIDVPSQEEVHSFIPKFHLEYILDTSQPRVFGGLTYPDMYPTIRYQIQAGIENVSKIYSQINKEFHALFQRQYSMIEPYQTDDAEVIVVASATTASTALDVIDHFRTRKKKVGLLNIRMFRPFPAKEVSDILSDAKKIVVIDRNISFGSTGIFFQEITSALYQYSKTRPLTFNFIAGLGGSDITPELIEEIINEAFSLNEPTKPIWKGVYHDAVKPAFRER